MSNNTKEQKELLSEFEERFLQWKKERGFKASLDELDEIFFLRDSILSAGFVSFRVGRQVCSRIVDTFMSWNNHIQNVVMSPGSMIYMNENKMLSQEDKKEMLHLVSRSMALVSSNSLAGLTKDGPMEAAFVDEAVTAWKREFLPTLSKTMAKINDGWKK